MYLAREFKGSSGGGVDMVYYGLPNLQHVSMYSAANVARYVAISGHNVWVQ